MLVSVTAVLWLGLAAAQPLELKEGDTCRQEHGVIRTCNAIKNCHEAVEVGKTGEESAICGHKDKEPLVCCESKRTSPPKPGAKSREMCEKYGELVFATVPNFIPDEDPIKLDTCAVYEPLITLDGPTPRMYPHMALLGYEVDSKIEWLCEGSLISDRFVLSAAHCTYAGSKRGLAKWVRLGEYKINSDTDEALGQAKAVNYEIQEMISHPDFKLTSLYNDIALYKLKKTVTFDEFVRPICLHTDHQLGEFGVLATGWSDFTSRRNRKENLQSKNFSIISAETCNEVYGGAKSRKLESGINDQKMFCATYRDSYEGFCQGNFGGPLQIPLKKPYCMHSQEGITSIRAGCAGDDLPGIYTRVSHYVPWIESIVWS